MPWIIILVQIIISDFGISRSPQKQIEKFYHHNQIIVYLTTYRTKLEFQLALQTNSSQIFLILGKLVSGWFPWTLNHQAIANEKLLPGQENLYVLDDWMVFFKPCTNTFTRKLISSKQTSYTDPPALKSVDLTKRNYFNLF